MSVTRCHYETFGVSRNATHRELTKAYATLTSPLWAKAASLSANENNRLKAINIAWDVLRHPERRAAYNATLSPIEETGSNTGTTSGAAESNGGSNSGETTTSGSAQSDSGTKGKAGSSGINPEPHPKSERKEKPKHHDNHGHHYNRKSYDPYYPFGFVSPDKYRPLRAMHTATAPRPAFRPVHRHHLRTFALG